MKLARDLAVIGITAILAAPFGRLHAAHADDEVLLRAPQLPVLDLDGVAVSIDRQAAKGGTPEASATLKAVNKRDVPVERTVRVQLFVSPPVRREARMILPPVTKWSKEITVALRAGETKAIEVRTGVSVGESETAGFTIRADAKVETP